MKLNTSHFTHVRDCVRYIKVQNHACTKPFFGSFVREILNENDYLSKNNLLTETASNDNNICQGTEIHLGGSSWWYSKHIPIDFIEILLPFPVNCPRTIIFWLIFRYQSFSLQNTLSSKCMPSEKLRNHKYVLSDQAWNQA
jgi:hypothetical protein